VTGGGGAGTGGGGGGRASGLSGIWGSSSVVWEALSSSVDESIPASGSMTSQRYIERKLRSNSRCEVETVRDTSRNHH
jgi:hypothetical protein